MQNIDENVKNITIVVSAMNMGGAQRVVSILSNYWSKKNFTVTLIHTYTKDKINHYKLDDQIHNLYLKNIRIVSKINFLNRISKLIQLRSLIKKSNPDVIISFLTTINVATTIAALFIKSPLYICERISTPFASLSKNFFWIYRLLFKRVSKIIVQTKKNKSYLNQNFPNMIVEVIPNLIIYPIPITGFSKKPNTVISPNRKIILAAGRFHKFKQFDILIKAFWEIKDKYPNWDLVILGDGEEKEALIQLILDLEIDDRVFSPGIVGNVSEWYERSDLFVLSSLIEGFPNVLLEAMSYGLPCVSFDCNTGPRELIKNEINGILVPPNEKELGLSNAMSKFMGDEKFRRKISKEAELTRKNNSIQNIIEKWNKCMNL